MPAHAGIQVDSEYWAATAHKDEFRFSPEESEERRPEQTLGLPFRNYQTIALVLFSRSLIRSFVKLQFRSVRRSGADFFAA
jgi:hypothetical protein